MRHSLPELLAVILAMAAPWGAVAGSSPEDPPAIYYPAPADRWVNDFAGLLTIEERREIASSARDLERRTGIECTVVTIRSLATYGAESRSIETFSLGLFNEWGVGEKSANAGIVILLCLDPRKVHIQLGAGFPPDANQVASALISSTIVPLLKQQKPGEALLAGVRGADRSFSELAPAADFGRPGAPLPPRAPAVAGPVPAPPPSPGGVVGPCLIVLAAGAFLLFAGIDYGQKPSRGVGSFVFTILGAVIQFTCFVIIGALLSAIFGGRSSASGPSGGSPFGGGHSSGGGASGDW